MSRYGKAKGRSESGQFAALPHRCLAHENYTRLSSRAIRLLVDMAYQYNGSNNGDLTAAPSILQKRGWRSKETIRLAILELLHFGWITLTRQGGLNRIANLYAVTFNSIDECGGKLDVQSSRTPSGEWKQQVGEWEKPPKWKAIDERRKEKLETASKKTSVRKPYLVSTESVPMNTETGT
jgi:hypothetical protein